MCLIHCAKRDYFILFGTGYTISELLGSLRGHSWSHSYLNDLSLLTSIKTTVSMLAATLITLTSFRGSMMGISKLDICPHIIKTWVKYFYFNFYFLEGKSSECDLKFHVHTLPVSHSYKTQDHPRSTWGQWATLLEGFRLRALLKGTSSVIKVGQMKLGSRFNSVGSRTWTRDSPLESLCYCVLFIWILTLESRINSKISQKCCFSELLKPLFIF